MSRTGLRRALTRRGPLTIGARLPESDYNRLWDLRERLPRT